MKLSEYESLIADKTCGYDDSPLGAIESYDHDGGWTVDGLKRKQWLYATCLKCGYQWSIWKLGVGRE